MLWSGDWIDVDVSAYIIYWMLLGLKSSAAIAFIGSLLGFYRRTRCTREPSLLTKGLLHIKSSHNRCVCVYVCTYVGEYAVMFSSFSYILLWELLDGRRRETVQILNFLLVSGMPERSFVGRQTRWSLSKPRPRTIPVMIERLLSHLWFFHFPLLSSLFRLSIAPWSLTRQEIGAAAYIRIGESQQRTR